MKFSTDKQLHFIVGFLLNILFYFVVFKDDYITSLMVVGIVGIIKELLDFFNENHTFEFFDFLATLFGGAVFTCIIGLIKLFM